MTPHSFSQASLENPLASPDAGRERRRPKPSRCSVGTPQPNRCALVPQGPGPRIGAHGEVDRAHSAMANLLQDFVGAYAPSHYGLASIVPKQARSDLKCGRLQEARRLFMRREESSTSIRNEGSPVQASLRNAPRWLTSRSMADRSRSLIRCQRSGHGCAGPDLVISRTQQWQ